MKLNNPFPFDHEGIEKDFDDSHYISLDPPSINPHQAKHGENNWLRAPYESHLGPSKRRKLKENDKSMNAEFPFDLSEEMKDDIEDIPWNEQSDGDINTHNLSKLRSDADMSIQSKKKRASISTRVKKCRQRKEKFYRDLEERAARLEKKCEMLTKEVSDYKTRLAYYEAIDNKTDSENPQSVDSKFLDNVRKKIQESHADDLTVVKAVEKVRNLYGPFGQEKLKVLESSFECFLENILSGSHLKIAFYACEDFPKNYTEYQKYLKLKKYQQHEKYPDEHVREFINYRQSWLKTKVEFNNWTKNMLPAMKMIREEMKVAIKKLLDARYNIYKTLMRLDLFMEFLPNIPLNRQELMQILEETKHSDFVISSKEALGISEEEIEVIETVKVPKQNIFKNYLVLQNLLSEDEKAPKQFQKMYKFRKLSFVDK